MLEQGISVKTIESCIGTDKEGGLVSVFRLFLETRSFFKE